ncbi:MAG: [FeFe] hydrogenase H-cluster radical SAM maturase HydE [Firmicutes bacterium]|nr:[FeFe] hydrogenase H-cluster radical SAM maturase HydE [Bacillota bacterium]
MKNLLNKLRDNNYLSYDELLKVIENIDGYKDILFQYAVDVRKKYYGTDVYMRGLIEFSNYCSKNCKYCGLRRDNKKVKRYRLSTEEILDCCKEGYRLGYRTFVLQSGEDPYFDDEKLISLVKKIKKNFNEAAITLSIGERSFESYKKLKNAGVDRYLLRHETASEDLYKSLHKDMSFSNRRKCIKALKDLNYQVGAGFMVGLPNQTNKDLVRDLLFLKGLEPEMVGIGPFISHPDTPLGEFENGTVEKTRIMLALTRLLLPKVLLPSTTALGTLDNLGREKALKSGANVVMPNLSPTSVRKDYEIYKDKICTGDEAAHCRKCIEGRINSAGYKVNMDRGDHISLQKFKKYI